MNHFKIIFENGDQINTGFNGTEDEARDYYLNNWFNFGDTDEIPNDIMVRGVSVDKIN